MEFNEIIKLFDAVDEDKRVFAIDALNEYIFFKNKISELQKLDLIRVDKTNPARQMITPAGKLIKDFSNVLDAKRNTLLKILYRVEGSAADELLNRLAEFE